ncbi:MAG: sodium-dependent bicarbonate transport family permease [Verrucomicrobiota bacterium]
MDTTLLTANLSSPPVLAFAAGVAAVFARSDLKIPEQIYQGLAIYLLISIGFKGGTALAGSNLSSIALPAAATILLGLVISVSIFYITKAILFKDTVNAAAAAAHYGSVSAVTFMACIAFLESRAISYEGYMTALMAVMEIPAIMAAIGLAKIYQKDGSGSVKLAIQEALAGKSVFLLTAGLIIGAVAGPVAAAKAEPFLVQPFYGVLIIFLLEMGLVAGNSMKGFKDKRKRLAVFALVAPLIQGTIGVAVGAAVGLSTGGATLLGTLAASASYIAAPAAVRIALPTANPSYYLFSSLGVTFPFNLIVGIPLYYTLAKSLT